MSTAPPSLRANLVELCSIDVRSLALFRMALGALVLLDVGNRALNLEAHYTDAGLLPRAVVANAYKVAFRYSVYNLSGETWFVAVLFALTALLAVAVVAGWGTRIALVLSWALMCSVQARNPVILQGGDDLIRLMLFWSIFLPLDEVWSVAARRRGHPAPPRRITSVATVAIMLQTCYVYWFSIPLKLGNASWLPNANAIWFALSADLFASRTGALFRDALGPDLLRPVTVLALMIELIGPCLAWIPVKVGWTRTATVLLFLGFHAVLGTLMEIGLFPLISSTSWLVFLPSAFWDALGARWPALRLPVGEPADGGAKRARIPPATPGTELRFGSTPVNLFVVFTLLYVTAWNVRASAPSTFTPAFPGWVNPFGRVLRLEQYWTMFSSPILQDGWIVVPAELADGTTVDLYTWAPVTQDKPDPVATHIGTDRWTKYHFNLWAKGHHALRPHYGDYLKRRWEEAHPGREVEMLRIVKMEETNTLEGPKPAVEKQLWLRRYTSSSGGGGTDRGVP